MAQQGSDEGARLSLDGEEERDQIWLRQSDGHITAHRH